MNFKLIFLVLLSGQIFIIKPVTGQAMVQAPSAIEASNLYDQSYGTDRKQKMDIFLPANRNDSTRLMVIIHGGAWVRGDKSEFAPYVSALQRLLPNYAFANINYRLYRNGANQFPAQEQDLKAAVQYLESKLGEFGISQKMVLLGASAGGHLALLQAYKNSETLKPLAVISFFGPTDLLDMYHNSQNPDAKPMLESLLGGSPSTSAEIYTNSSPVQFVNKMSPPTLLLQGGRDKLVNENQAKILQNKLNTVGVINELRIYPEEGHGWSGPSLFDSFVRIAAFLKKNVK